MSEVIKYDKESFNIEADVLLNAIKFRRSVRNFQKRPVEKEKLLRIIEAGRFTPTARNQQNVEYIVVQDNIEELEQVTVKEYNRVQGILKPISEENFIFRGATALILTISPHTVNASLASANMELMAEALGLGVVYVGYFTNIAAHSEEIKRMLGLNESQKIVTCLALGYPAVKYQRTVPRKKPVIRWM
jgi:nitroreductase